MESKGDTNFALELNFLKIDYYFCCNRNNGNSYPKTYQNFLEKIDHEFQC